MEETVPKPEIKSQYLYYRLSKMFYVFGAPNYHYTDDLGIPRSIRYIYDRVVNIMNALIWIFLVSTFGSLYTQRNWTDEQKNDTLFFNIAYFALNVCVEDISSKREIIREIGYNLIVKLKEMYNDPKVDDQMTRKCKFYCGMFGCCVIVVTSFYGVVGLIRVVFTGANFITAMITAWPDVADTRAVASAGRVLGYVLFCFTTLRGTFGGYIIVMILTISLSHQFRNVASYFRSLSVIFDNDTLTQEEKEEKYERAFHVGIEMHSNTLRCTYLSQNICNSIFTFLLVFTVFALCFYMFQMVQFERTTATVLKTAATMCCILASTGCIWCNAGDLTVEAMEVSTAMYSSGWQHCRETTIKRMRPVLVNAMCQSQIPVELRCLKVIPLSYGSYVSMVKASYSVFSVLI